MSVLSDRWGKGFRLLFDAGLDYMAVVSWSTELEVQSANLALCDALSTSEEEIVGKGFLSGIPDECRNVADRALQQIKTSDESTRFTAPYGSTGRYVDWSASPLGLSHLLLIGRDVTRDVRDKEVLYRRAHFDTVTGLPNRYLFKDRVVQGLANARRETRRSGIMFVDLDDFKPINDRHGHAVGDEILYLVAQRLLSGARDTDTVCRRGGDEFVVFLTMLPDADDVSALSDRLSAAFDAPFETSVGPVSVSASHGFAIFPDSGCDFDAVMNRADARMYQHKESKGKG